MIFKVKRYYLPCLAFVFLFSCNYKKLDLEVFSIEVPQNWIKEFPYHPIDGYAGVIKAPGFSLDFDYSGQGFASSLMETETQYLQRAKMHLNDSPEQHPDTNATPVSVPLDEIPGSMEVKRKDTSVTISKPTKEQKLKFPASDYIANIKVNGKTTLVPITIPNLIKRHNVSIDTSTNYITKTIWPKVAGHGMTGVYIRSRKSTFNFQMNSRNLSAKDQADVLKAFKTITFKP